VLLGAVVILTAGCKEDSAPAPLSLAELPGAMTKAFAKAVPELKDLSKEIISAVQAQEYPKAYMDLQALAAKSGLNKEQSSVTVRALLAVNGQLQTAQSKGDEKAAETLQYIRKNK
jgi:virulence-associated protein VapD